MATFKIYKLHFTSALHIGDRRDDYGISLRYIPSDTMYAALTACLAKIGEEIPKNGDLGFAISSLFPFYQESKDATPVYFFPKPLQQKMPQIKDLTKAKKVKKIAWVDKSYFEKILCGKPIFDGNDENIANIHKQYLSSTKIDGDFIRGQVEQHVKISRNYSEDSEPYYVEKIFFSKESGLYFMVEGNTELLDKAIGLLAEEGIGTDRSVGCGTFNYEKTTINIELPSQCEYMVSMSMLIPESKEQLLEMTQLSGVAYDFERRGGWITTYPYNSIRKNVIYAFTAGSVFAGSAQGPLVLGKIVNLAPKTEFVEVSHPIWRSGKAIMLPTKI